MIKVVTIIRKIERLRKAIRQEGTPAIQDAWDEMEPHVSAFIKGEAANGTAGPHGAYGGGTGQLG